MSPNPNVSFPRICGRVKVPPKSTARGGGGGGISPRITLSQAIAQIGNAAHSSGRSIVLRAIGHLVNPKGRAAFLLGDGTRQAGGIARKMGVPSVHSIVLVVETNRGNESPNPRSLGTRRTHQLKSMFAKSWPKVSSGMNATTAAE